MDFDGFITEIKKNEWEVYGAEVYINGELAHSFGDTTINRYPIYSATKTITSIAAGLAIDEGKLELEKSILCYLPDELISRITPSQLKVYQDVTLKRLLTMSVKGYPFQPSEANWLSGVFQYPLEDIQNKVFDYSNVTAYLAGVTVSCAIKEDLYEYLDHKLFNPLKIEKPPYSVSPDGYFYGSSNMELTVNELSRIGLLLMNRGVYMGHRILSEHYVDEATSIQQMNREGGYGYFIWKYRDGFSINGKWNQKCYCLPKQGVMITYLSHIEDESIQLKECMEKYLLGLS